MYQLIGSNWMKFIGRELLRSVSEVEWNSAERSVNSFDLLHGDKNWSLWLDGINVGDSDDCLKITLAILASGFVDTWQHFWERAWNFNARFIKDRVWHPPIVRRVRIILRLQIFIVSRIWCVPSVKTLD